MGKCLTRSRRDRLYVERKERMHREMEPGNLETRDVVRILPMFALSSCVAISRETCLDVLHVYPPCHLLAYFAI